MLKKKKYFVEFITWILSMSMSTFYFYTILGLLYKLDLIGKEDFVLVPLVLGLIVSIILTKYIHKQIKSNQKSRVASWLYMNLPNLLLIYFFSTFIFNSIKKEIIWSFEDFKNIISLQWSIFGITVSIFLFWQVIIKEQLKKNQPTKADEYDFLREVIYIDEKEDFYFDIENSFSSIIFIFLNLIMLLVSTAMVYFSVKQHELLTQNVLTISFYFCTNTLFTIFTDIITPLIKEHRAMKKVAKLTKEEIDRYNKINTKVYDFIDMCQKIDGIESIAQEEKTVIKESLLACIAADINPPQEEDDKKEEESK